MQSFSGRFDGVRGLLHMQEYVLAPIGKAYDTSKTQAKFLDEARAAFESCITKQKQSQHDDDPAAKGPAEWMGHGDFDDLKTQITRAVHRDCRSQAHHALGSVYFVTGRYRDAIAEYDQAIWYVQQYTADTLFSMALCHMNLGDERKCLSALDLVLQEDSEHSDALCLKFQLTTLRGDKDTTTLRKIFEQSQEVPVCGQLFHDLNIQAIMAVTEPAKKDQMIKGRARWSWSSGWWVWS